MKRNNPIPLFHVISVLPCFLYAQEKSGIYYPGQVINSDVDSLSNSKVTIDAGEMDARSSRSVDDALNFIQGVRVTVGENNEPEIMIRGIKQDKLLMLFDGVPVNPLYSGYLDMSYLPLSDAGRIEVIKGAASPLYGSNALGGVINVITKQPEGIPVFKLRGRFGDRKNEFGNVSYMSSRGKFYGGMSITSDIANGYVLGSSYVAEPNENGGIRENSDHKKLTGMVKAGYKPDEKKEVVLSLMYNESQKGIPPDSLSASPRYLRSSGWRYGLVNLNYFSRISEALTVRSRIYWNANYNAREVFKDGSYDVATSTKNIFDSFSAGTQVYSDLKVNNSNTLSFGMNLKGDFHNEWLDSGGSRKEKYHMNTYSFALEDELRYNDRYFFRAGANLDYYGEAMALSPVFNMLFRPDDETSINFDFSIKTAFATLYQLYSPVSGNAALTPERNTGVELGIARGKDEFKYGISMFANSIFDRIERKNTASSYINIMESGINGIETYFRAQPLENLSIFAGYAYTVAKEVYPQFTGRNDNELEYVPGNKWDFILNYMPVPGLKVNLLGMVNGRMYAYDENGAQLTINAYTLWNARVSYNVIENTTLSVSLNNILNSNYAEEPGYPQEGRSIIGTIDLLY